MIGIDTNILVRYIVQDDVAQAKAATTFLFSLGTLGPGHISAATLVELTWVLMRGYGASRRDIVDVVEDILGVGFLVVQHASSARAAVERCKASNADFADAYIAAMDAEAGCSETVTFDKDAAKRAGMRLLA